LGLVLVSPCNGRLAGVEMSYYFARGTHARAYATTFRASRNEESSERGSILETNRDKNRTKEIITNNIQALKVAVLKWPHARWIIKFKALIVYRLFIENTIDSHRFLNTYYLTLILISLLISFLMLLFFNDSISLSSFGIFTLLRLLLKKMIQ